MMEFDKTIDGIDGFDNTDEVIKQFHKEIMKNFHVDEKQFMKDILQRQRDLMIYKGIPQGDYKGGSIL